MTHLRSMIQAAPASQGRSAGTAWSRRWEREWTAVPPQWRELFYYLDLEPHAAAFHTGYRGGIGPGRRIDLTPAGQPRIAQEMAWWIHSCWSEGLRRVSPSTVRWWWQTIESLAAGEKKRPLGLRDSVLDWTPTAVIDEAMTAFEQRNGRPPCEAVRSSFSSMAAHIHWLLSVRCTDAPWWEHNCWSLTADPRIPRRPHEPLAESTLNLATIAPLWLREGIRFWLRSALTLETLTWSSVIGRVNMVGGPLGRFCLERGFDHPVVTADEHELRLIFMDYRDWVGEQRTFGRTKSAALSRGARNTNQSSIQAFYQFMFDHRGEAAAATGDPRWLELDVNHTRLWAPSYRSHRSIVAPRGPEPMWIATADLQQMVDALPVLAAPMGEVKKIRAPDGSVRTVKSLGDESAMRIWLIQAMTGRRASEILMLDFDPITPLAAVSPAEAEADQGTFVARLHYQQTKINGVDPTILVEQAVVDVIREQQRWVRERFPRFDGPYLFVNPWRNYRGLNPRSYPSYSDSLNRFDDRIQLKSANGYPLLFSHTHRLRHTRATELLNAGVAQHVVQRYLGHRSPEMTMHYAQTLASTAEAEFLRYKKVGADGRDIGLSAKDIYEITELDKRTDRILPNGVCLLPPVMTCDKGNACLSCGHFATDQTHLEELTDQRSRTLTLIDIRNSQHRGRTGQELGEENIWILGRRRELASLDAIIDRLDTAQIDTAIAGPGTAGRTADSIRIDTDGAHRTLLRAAVKEGDQNR